MDAQDEVKQVDGTEADVHELRRRSAPTLEQNKTYPSPPQFSNTMECHICESALGMRKFKVKCVNECIDGWSNSVL